MGLIVNPRDFGNVSRRFTDGATTEGMTTIAQTFLADITGAFSISMWLRRRATPAGNRTFITCDGSGSGWNVSLRTTNILRLTSALSGVIKSRESTSTLATDVWTSVVCRDTALGTTGGSSMDFVFNGVAEAGVAGSDGTGSKSLGTPRALLVANTNQGSPMDKGPIAIWRRKVGDNEARQLYLGADPRDFASMLLAYWPMDGRQGYAFEPDLSGMGLPLFSRSTAAPSWGPPIPRAVRYRPRSVSAKAPASGAYTLTASTGSFALTGTATALKADRKLTATVATFAETGIATRLAKGFKFAAATGAFSLTGIATGVTAQRKLSTTVGAFSETGIAAALRCARKLTSAVGPFTLNGIDVTLQYSGAGKVLTASRGVFTFTGNAVSLRVQRKLAPSVATFTLTGNAVGLTWSGTPVVAAPPAPRLFLKHRGDVRIIRRS